MGIPKIILDIRVIVGLYIVECVCVCVCVSPSLCVYVGVNTHIHVHTDGYLSLSSSLCTGRCTYHQQQHIHTYIHERTFETPPVSLSCIAPLLPRFFFSASSDFSPLPPRKPNKQQSQRGSLDRGREGGGGSTQNSTRSWLCKERKKKVSSHSRPPRPRAACVHVPTRSAAAPLFLKPGRTSERAAGRRRERTSAA